jgi:hypothetical protein
VHRGVKVEALVHRGVKVEALVHRGVKVEALVHRGVKVEALVHQYWTLLFGTDISKAALVLVCRVGGFWP